MESIMQFYVTFSQHVKNSIIALHEGAIVSQERNDGAFCVPVGDTVEASDYAHLIQESDSSWFTGSIIRRVTNAMRGVAGIYPRLGAA